MKKNGFTLVELIGIVAIIALVMLVTVPRIMSTLTKSTNDKTENFKNDLELSASNYVESNWGIFKDEYILKINENKKNVYCLSLQTLMDSGYIEKTEIDPSTNTILVTTGKYIILEDISTSTKSYKFSYTYTDVSADENSACSDWRD